MDVVEASAEVATSMIESRHIHSRRLLQRSVSRSWFVGVASLCSLIASCIACVCVACWVDQAPCTMLKVLKLVLGCRLE